MTADAELRRRTKIRRIRRLAAAEGSIGASIALTASSLLYLGDIFCSSTSRPNETGRVVASRYGITFGVNEP